MKTKKMRIIFALIALTLVLCLGIGVAFAASSGSFSPKYEKPAISDIMQQNATGPVEDAYPEEIDSSASPNAGQKEWYEYITYSDKPVNEKPIVLDDGATRVYYYDPLDYSYGMIMDTTVRKDEEPLPTDFDSANTIKISVKNTHHFEVTAGANQTFESSLTSTIKASAGAGVKDFYWAEVGTEITSKLSSTLDVNLTVNEYTDKVTEIEKTFHASHFNSEGVPYMWRLVNYTVYLPLKCDVQFLKNGEWVSTGEDVYCLLATVQGTCRQYIKNETVMMEHWGTGESVTVDEFWDGFFTENELKEAYQDKLLPRS